MLYLVLYLMLYSFPYMKTSKNAHWRANKEDRLKRVKGFFTANERFYLFSYNGMNKALDKLSLIHI